MFQYWTPPIRRLPPLLWVRIRADLASYLVDRGADGTQVTCWYHRQFVQAAQDRYLSDPFEKKGLSSSIADYFLGRNYVGKFAFLFVFLLVIKTPPSGKITSLHPWPVFRTSSTFPRSGELYFESGEIGILAPWSHLFYRLSRDEVEYCVTTNITLV